ncbi:MAG: hypothetical protein R6W48_07150 [Gaiellaceae bacterium]
MAKQESDAEYWARQDEQRRELEELFNRMRERHRRADEREARRRERLRRLTLGLLGREPNTA